MLDGVASPCASPQAYGPLGDGSHTFTVGGEDAAHNPGGVAIYTWTIDTTAPVATIDAAPDAASTSPAAHFAFSSSESGSTFVCALDGGVFATCSTQMDYSGLADGLHTFQVEAIDPAGNIGSPSLYSWTIASLVITTKPPPDDVTPPAPVGRVVAHIAYGAASLFWQDPGDLDFDHVIVSKASGRGDKWAAVYTGPGTSYMDKPLNNGINYRYKVITYDHAGNASPAVFATVAASALLVSPKQGARLGPNPTLAWKRIRGAAFYNVQVFRGGRKVLSLWPKASRLSLPIRWTYERRQYGLSRGVYRWYVWPAVGGRYGALEGQSSFRIG
jgi:hypothetical protein